MLLCLCNDKCLFHIQQAMDMIVGSFGVYFSTLEPKAKVKIS